MSKTLADVKRYLWLHGTTTDETVAVELLRDLTADYEALEKACSDVVKRKTKKRPSVRVEVRPP